MTESSFLEAGASCVQAHGALAFLGRLSRYFCEAVTSTQTISPA